MDFAKKKGWIVDYKVLGNVHAREGEPDLYLVTVFEEWASNAEYDKRYNEYVEYMNTTNVEIEEQSGERVVMRKLKSDFLLMEYVLK